MEPIWTEFVQELGTEIRHREHGGAEAFAHLKPNTYRCVAEPYSDEAFRLWDEARRTVGDDPEILHHLAIMHHARAIDLEHGSEPSRSDDDWRAADHIWAKLCESALFWTDFAAFARVDTTLIDEARRDLAERCVRMHLAIAFEDIQSGEAIALERCRFHLDMAISSPFPIEVVEVVRANAYAREMTAVQAVAWQDGCLDQDVLDHAIASIKKYLDVDPTYLPALRDLTSFLDRRQLCFVQEMNSLSAQLGSDNVAYSNCALRSVVHDIRAVSYVEPILKGFDELPQSQQYPVLERLVLWFDRLGMHCAKLDRYDEAIANYDRAIAFAEQHNYDNIKEMTELHEERLIALLKQVDGFDHCSDEHSRKLLDQRMAEISAEPDPPPALLLRRARLYLRRGDLDRAEADALALQAQLAAGMVESIGEIVRETDDLLDEIEVAQVTSRLKVPIESQNWPLVLATLEPHPRRSHPSLALLEIRAYCTLGRGSEARTLLQDLHRRLKETPNPALEFILEQAEDLVRFLPPEQGTTLDEATLLDEAGDPAGAITICDGLIAAEPANCEAYLLRARCRDRVGDGIGARADLDHAEEVGLERGDPAILVQINEMRASLESGDFVATMAREKGIW